MRAFAADARDGTPLFSVARRFLREGRLAEAYLYAAAAHEVITQSRFTRMGVWPLWECLGACSAGLGHTDSAERWYSAMYAAADLPQAQREAVSGILAHLRRQLHDNEPLKLFFLDEPKYWTAQALEHVRHVSVERLEDADFFVIPHCPEPPQCRWRVTREWLEPHVALAKRYDIPFVAFLHDDPKNTLTPWADHGVLFRTSMTASTAGASEYPLPSFLYYDASSIQPFEPTASTDPLIGFAGMVVHEHRRRCIRAFEGRSDVPTRFIVRDLFHLHHSEDQHGAHREEFIDIMRQCPFQLSPSGGGNYSHRTYETMMYGRIPVLVNFDLRLPAEDMVCWRDYLPVARSPAALPDTVLRWLSKHDRIAAQRLSRRLWEEQLSPRGFAPHVARVLRRHRLYGVPGIKPRRAR